MRRLALWLAALTLACGGEPPAAPPSGSGFNPNGVTLPSTLFGGRADHSERAAPIVGGTLLITRDDSTAVAADPDRDRVSFVNLHTLKVVSSELDPGSSPGRLVELGSGRIAVILQGAGAVAAFEPDGSPVFRSPVCSHPRGLAYVAAQNALAVVCRSGVLAKLDADSGLELSRQRLDDDLVDVLVRGEELVLTRGRSSELIYLDASGNVLRRGNPAGLVSMAFRSVLLPNGEILMPNQAALPQTGDLYGSFATCGVHAVSMKLSITLRVSGPATTTPPADPREMAPAARVGFEVHSLDQFAGPIDVAVSAAGGKVALLDIGNGFASDLGIGSLMLLSLDSAKGAIAPGLLEIADSCQPLRMQQIAGQPVAVALDSRGRPFVQSREPAALVLDNGVSIALGREPRFDAGLALFYMNTGGRVSCASCHPGGLEDGRTWLTSNHHDGLLLPRRTQSLAGGIKERAPYFWSGELSTFREVVDEVMRQRMGVAIAPTLPQVQALQDWLQGVPAPSDLDELDLAAVERGRALFFDPAVGCSFCHGGAAFTDDLSHAIDTGGTFYTPSLVAARARAPYFHDGCAPDLRRALGVCGGPVHDPSLESAQIDDLAAFLLSL